MSTSRRTFFKGVVGGIGALALGDIILSQRGWGGLLSPTKAFAQEVYYKLADDCTFFEGKITDPNPEFIRHAPHYVRQARGRYPIQQIFDLRDAQNPRAYNLNVSGAFITRHLLADIDVGLLSQLYASRFGGNAAEARNRIMAFINSSNLFMVNTNVPSLPPAPPNKTPANYDPPWADFSMGSAYAIGVSKIP